ncbi:MAG: glycosyl hydrolase family 18 protein [Chitinophagaceae bacterium]
MNRIRKIGCILLLAAYTIACNNKTIVLQPQKDIPLRVLGYLPGSPNWVDAINAVDLTKITDLNLAFINPDASGNFPANDVYRQVIEKAHSYNVKVFLSIGGGSPPSYLAGLLKDDKRGNLISSLAAVADTYGFDGIDVDLENALINADYAPFVSGLSVALKAKNKLMTAALASWNSNLISDTTLQLYDFINIMSYDKTGPWNLNKPGPHSPFTMVQDDFTYFNQTRKIAAEKLFIGLPFYGYGFGNGAPQSMKYKDIVTSFAGAENTDSVAVAGGGTIYYNGIPTIKQKVSFAIANKAGGVMIWQLLGDSKDSLSLLKVIADTKKQ